MSTVNVTRLRQRERFTHFFGLISLRAMLALLLAALSGALSASEELAILAERGRDKIDAIITLGERERSPAAAETLTLLTEAEINAYLTVYGPEELPHSMASPAIRLREGGRIHARAMIDLSAVRSSRPRAWNDPLAYVTGMVEVVATGRVVAQDGVGLVLLDTGTVAGVSVPTGVVQELIRFYTATPDNPGGFDLDKPFELPLNIRHILVESGHATVVQ